MDNATLKYDYRIVSRNTLADIEQAVRQLEGERWVMQDAPNDLTIPQALRAIVRREAIQVNMKREQNG